MGLDVYIVTSFTMLNEEERPELTYEEMDDALWVIDAIDTHPHSIHQEGVYKGDEVGHHYIGSYGSFHSWRLELARMVGVNFNTSQPTDTFGHLLSHSDCGGALGGSEVDDLVNDFRIHRLRAQREMTRSHFLVYEMWRGIIEGAQNVGGVVYFS